MMTGGYPTTPPPDIPTLLEWWNPRTSVQTQNSDGSGGASGNGDPVGRITGTVSGNFLIQATDASRPTLRSSGPNGPPAWQLDGADFLTADGLAATFAGSDVPFTVIVAAKFTALAAAQCLFSLGANTAAQPHHVLDFSTSMHDGRRGDSGAISEFNASQLHNTTSAAVWGMTFGPGGELWKNAALIKGQALQDVPDCTFTRLSCGVFRRAANTEFLTGYLMDVALYTSALSAAQMSAVMAYIAQQNQISL